MEHSVGSAICLRPFPSPGLKTLRLRNGIKDAHIRNIRWFYQDNN